MTFLELLPFPSVPVILFTSFLFLALFLFVFFHLTFLLISSSQCFRHLSFRVHRVTTAGSLRRGSVRRPVNRRFNLLYPMNQSSPNPSAVPHKKLRYGWCTLCESDTRRRLCPGEDNLVDLNSKRDHIRNHAGKSKSSHFMGDRWKRNNLDIGVEPSSHFCQHRTSASSTCFT